MEPSVAARYLQPRAFVIALAAATPTLGDLGLSAFPLLYALVADQAGLPHAVPLPPYEPPATLSTPSYMDILHVLRSIPFLPNPTMADHHAVHLPDNAQVSTVDHALHFILDAVLQSPDGLVHATELMEPHIDPAMCGVYEPDAVISCFLRKVCIAFASLSFEALSRLLHDLRLFVNPSLDSSAASFSYTKRAVLPDPIMLRKAAFDLAQGMPVESVPSFTACASLYAQSRRAVSATNLGFQSLGYLGHDRRHSMALPGAEYVIHLEAQRRCDLAVSVDALHRYFDLSLSEIGRVTKPVKEKTADNAEEGAAQKTARDDMQGHQYAALSLAILHANFGDSKKASAVLDDTIRAAQHCGDEACQARALNWKARTSSSIAKRHQLLRHANDNLALAREELCTVFTPVSDDVPDTVSLHSVPQRGRTQEESEERSLGSISSARLSRIRGRLDYRNPTNRIDSLLMSAAAWEAHAASSTALSVARRALLIAEEKDGPRLSAKRARAIVAVASLMDLEGNCNEAATLLESSLQDACESDDLHCSTNAPEIELLRRCKVWIELELSLRRGDIRQATKLCQTLTELVGSGLYSNASFEKESLILDAVEAKCILHLANRASKQAAFEAENLCQYAASFGRPARVVEGLRLRAESYLLASAYTAALPAALAAASLSHGLGLESAHIRSVMTLTEIMLQMEGHEPLTSGTNALEALKPVLVKALGGMGLRVRARAYRLHAECLLAIAAGSKNVPNDSIVDLLHKSSEAYHQCGDTGGQRDCFYLLARTHHWRKEEGDRNTAAFRYRQQLLLLSRRQACLSVARE